MQTACAHCYRAIDENSAYCKYCGKRQTKSRNKSSGRGRGIKAILLLAVVGGIVWYAENSDKIGELWPSKPSPTPIVAKATAVPATQRPSLPVPRNGDVTKYTYRSHDAPFEVTTPAGSDYYFVTLVESSNHRLKIVSVFIHPGKTVKIHVPLGKYEMYYATGTSWYGRKDLFGKKGGRYKADTILNFYEDNNGFMGHTIELIKQVGGNLETHAVSEDEFPI